MANEFSPILDQWYWHHDKGQAFFVTEIDDDERVVTLQHYDGSVEALTLSEWRQLDIEPRAEPENWSGALDVSEVDDLGTEITDTTNDDWQEPLRQFVSDESATSMQDGSPDDYGEGHIAEEVAEMDNIGNEPPVEEPGVTQRPDGVFEELFDDDWYAEYVPDAETGLWRVSVYRKDTAEWTDGEYDSLEDAQVAARNVMEESGG